MLSLEVYINWHKQPVLYPYTLSTIPPSTGQNQCYGNILLYETSVISTIVSHFDYKHRCLVGKNVPIVLILPSRWQDGAGSLGIERTSCLWFKCHRRCFITKLRHGGHEFISPITNHLRKNYSEWGIVLQWKSVQRTKTWERVYINHSLRVLTLTCHSNVVLYTTDDHYTIVQSLRLWF